MNRYSTEEKQQAMHPPSRLSPVDVQLLTMSDDLPLLRTFV